MGLASSLKKVSSKLINKFGNTITLINRDDVGVPDIANGTQSATITQIETKGVYEDIVGEDEVDGKYTIASTVNITMFTSIKDASGKEMRIISITTVDTQTTVIIYEVLVASDNTKKTQ